MKKVTQIPNMKNIEKEIYKKISKIVDLSVDKSFESIPKNLKKWLNPKLQLWMKILSIFTFLITFLLMTYKLNKVNKHIIFNLDESILYKEAFNLIKELDLDKIEDKKDKKELFINRIPFIPSDATIIESTNVIHLKVNKKYTAYIQMGTAMWQRNISDDKVQTFYKNTGYLKIKTDDLMPDLNFSLDHKHRIFGKKIKLENPEFNKKMNLTSNDPIKIRMLYTPLCMEETLKYNKNINKLDYWKVYKNKKEIKIIFDPKDIKTVCINIPNKGLTTKESIKHYIKKDISKDIVNLYSIIFVVLIPPML